MWMKSWCHLSQQKCWHLFQLRLAIESNCDAPPGPSGKNLKIDGQLLSEPTKQNVKKHINWGKKKKQHGFITKVCYMQLGIHYLSTLTVAFVWVTLHHLGWCYVLILSCYLYVIHTYTLQNTDKIKTENTQNNITPTEMTFFSVLSLLVPT